MDEKKQDKITRLKVEVFDLIRHQGNLQVEINKLRQRQDEKVIELQNLERQNNG